MKLLLDKKYIPEGSRIVLGLSGGPDSMYLLHQLVTLRTNGYIKEVFAAHLDHQWRSNSSADEQFCRNACMQLNVLYESITLSKVAITPKGSQEEIGRAARRAYLETVRKKNNADLIVLGHHLQDQEETFLIRLIRGTSLTGLCAMWPKKGYIVRPLLELSKQEILAWLDEKKIAYLIDPSNELETFLRNKIRKQVIPALQACDERFDQNFLATLQRLQETELYLQEQTNNIFAQISKKEDSLLLLDKNLFLQQPTIMQYRLLMHWLTLMKVPFPPAQAFLDEIIRFLQQPGSKQHTIHEKWHIHKKKNSAWITY